MCQNFTTSLAHTTMPSLQSNIFGDIPEFLTEELLQTLLRREQLQIERIVSQGHASPEGFWYDQNQDEWVILLQGQAVILFEHDQIPNKLNTGDYLLIPAHTRHRVEWTQPSVDTIWLAVHFRSY